jgi:hypothetical protein
MITIHTVENEIDFESNFNPSLHYYGNEFGELIVLAAIYPR